MVDVRATKGEAVLRRLLETDRGAAQLGEVALVPLTSPVGESGLVFHNALFDENAASHMALGASYRHTIDNAESLSDDEFVRRGGNESARGSRRFHGGPPDLHVNGIRENGAIEPIIRRGEWAFETG